MNAFALLGAVISLLFCADCVQLPSSCNEITQDGLYYVKPTRDGTVIPVICSNGYAMIDLSLDNTMRSYPAYLSSWNYGRNNMDYILPNLDDESTFRQWWLPSDGETQFSVAPNCNACQLPTADSANTVYYTDSALFCFAVYPLDACTNDIETQFSCNQCDVFYKRIHCVAMQMDADTPINHDHDQCVTHGLVYRPSMSLIRDACTCYQPSQPVVYFTVDESELPPVTSSDLLPNTLYIDDNIVFADTENVDDIGGTNCIETNKVYLTNEQFKSGTYRIQQCGEYILSEDIVFNFNPPKSEQETDEHFSPNSIDNEELYWFPTHDDDISGKYEGLYSYIGTYSLGFFAGITVEADDVKINLNGYSMSMEYAFYVQQRYFTLIEMGAKYFLPNQGPGNWDVNEQFYASNLEIFGGTLGRSSHHSIHGLRNDNVYIHDIVARDFDVAGIQCNGCQNVVIGSCDIGPQNSDIPVLGRYAHARALLPRLKQLMNEYGDEQITFYNREAVKVAVLIQRLINQMDLIYDYAVNENNMEHAVDDEEWIAAQKLFSNPSGWMDGGSSYGIVISGDGAAVVGIGLRTANTRNISISNTDIHGVYNNVVEKLKTGNDDLGAMRLMLFDTVDWIDVMSDEWMTDNNIDETTYIGDAYTDCIFAIYQYIDSWMYLNSLFLTKEAAEFVFNGGSPRGIFGHGLAYDGGASPGDGTAVGCNTDIQLHSSKGAIGLRIDGGDGILLHNVRISDIQNIAALGHDWCGEYAAPGVSNEDPEIQYGYTGTRAHGLAIDYAVNVEMDGIYIENVQSVHGEANGMVIYKQCEVDINGVVVVAQIKGGTSLSEQEMNALILPNLPPRACGLDVRDDTVVRMNTMDMVISDVFGWDMVNCFELEKAAKMETSTYLWTGLGVSLGLTMLAWICCSGNAFASVIAKITTHRNKLQDSNECTPLLSTI